MLILDKPRTFNGERISIPLYHRGALSLFPDAKVSICLLPRASGEALNTELLVSPAPFNSWGDLWRITGTFNERVGLVADLFVILGKHELNIVSAESSSIEREQFHKIEIVVDATRYSSAFGDGDHASRAIPQFQGLQYLEREILAALLPDVALLSGVPRIRIDRMWSLFHAHREYARAQARADAGLGPRPQVDTAYVSRRAVSRDLFSADGRDICIELPESMRETLTHAAETGETPGRRSVKYLTVSDTNERVLRIHLFDAKRILIWPSLVHVDREGACAAAATRIADAGFNILTSLSRLHKYGSVGTTEFVLEAPVGCESESAAFELLRLALSTKELAEVFAVKLDCAHTYGAEFDGTLVESNPDSLVSVPRRDSMGTQPLALLHGHIDRYVRRIQGGLADQRDHDRMRLARSIAGELSLARDEAVRTHLLFVSYAFRDADRLEMLRRLADKFDLKIVTGSKLRGVEITKRELVQRIDTCGSFLGVWTEDGAVEVHGKFWPSSWLHWELGVACARGLRCRLLVSESIADDAWRKIMGEAQQEVFRPGSFTESAEIVLGKFRQDIDEEV